MEKITVGDPTQNPNMGPVVNEKSMKSILGYVDKGIAEGGRLITGGERATEAGDGYFIKPTVIADVAPMGTISQQEIFGPVLAVIKSRGFEDGLAIANNTEFGLTGAVYTTSEDKIAVAKEQFHVGNLYINRKCTGAMVGAHPFGGFNMSGTDSKAGRSGLPVAVHAGEVDWREDRKVICRVAEAGREISGRLRVIGCDGPGEIISCSVVCRARDAPRPRQS